MNVADAEMCDLCGSEMPQQDEGHPSECSRSMPESFSLSFTHSAEDVVKHASVSKELPATPMDSHSSSWIAL